MVYIGLCRSESHDDLRNRNTFDPRSQTRQLETLKIIPNSDGKKIVSENPSDSLSGKNYFLVLNEINQLVGESACGSVKAL